MIYVSRASRGVAGALFIILITLVAPPLARAAVSIHLTIESPSGSIFNGPLTVTPCAATSTAPLITSGYCALEQSGHAIVWDWTWYSLFGLMLTSIDDISDGWWLWSYDDGSGVQDGMTSLDTHVLTDGETLIITNVTPDAPEPDPAQSSSIRPSGTADTLPRVVDPVAALNFLISRQAPDGSFSTALTSDWAAIALSAAEAPLEARNALITHLMADDSLTSVTDYERRAMALEALGIDPRPSGIITHIKDAFDGAQIGDPTLVNDDIFALLPLLHVGYDANDPIIKTVVAHILSHQLPDGSWHGVDLTSAAIQALTPLRTLPNVTDALDAARAYLSESRDSHGCWRNVYTNAWVLQALVALDTDLSAWQTPDGTTPSTCLALSQGADGAFERAAAAIENREWSTAYALPAALGKPWDTILTTFSRAPEQIYTEAVSPARVITDAHTPAHVMSTKEAITTSQTQIATASPLLASAAAPSRGILHSIWAWFTSLL